MATEGRRTAAVSVIRDIERLITADPGKRGIGPLAIEGELHRAATALYAGDVRHVGITTGFYILSAGVPETDGPLGALAIARALVKLGKKVTILTDEPSKRMMELATERSGLQGALEPLRIFPLSLPEAQWPAYFEEASGSFDHLVSIERCGAAPDGKYYNMRARDITEFTAPIDRFFNFCHDAKNIGTIGVGDGGNEIGMGKVIDLARQHVPLGETIACATATDHLIVTGISNWGGYALAASLQLLDAAHREAPAGVDPDVLVTRQQDSDILDAVLAAGAVDGPLCKCIRSVDGVAFDEYADTLETIRAKAAAAFPQQ